MTLKDKNIKFSRKIFEQKPQWNFLNRITFSFEKAGVGEGGTVYRFAYKLM